MSKGKGNLKEENITISDIRSTYPEEKGSVERYNLFGYFVLRRFSYYLAWLFIRLGVSANKVTGISIMIGFVGCILLAFGSYGGMVVGALILNIWALLEYVDGNVARATNSSSDYGAFIDDLNVYIISVIFFISAGIGAFNRPDTYLSSAIQFFLPINIDRSIFLILGGLSSSFYIFPSLVGNDFVRIFSQHQSNDNDIVAKTRGNIFGNRLYKIGWLNIRNITGLIMPIVLLAVVFGFLSLFVFFYALIMVCSLIGVTILILKKAKSSVINQQRDDK